MVISVTCPEAQMRLPAKIFSEYPSSAWRQVAPLRNALPIFRANWLMHIRKWHQLVLGFAHRNIAVLRTRTCPVQEC